jgi:AraC-like DNA-binding protein
MSAAAAIRWQYEGKTSGPHYEAWREEFGRSWIRADLIPIPDDYVTSEIAVSQLSFASLGRMRGTPLHMDRRRDFAAQEACSHLFLVLASGSPMQISQRGRSVDLAPGEMTLVSSSEQARLTQLMEGIRWSIRIPHRQVADICRNVEDKIARRIAKRGLSNLLLHQVETAQRFGPELDAATTHITAHYILDLVALSIGVGSDAAEIATNRGLAAARLDAIKAEILRRLEKPDLRLEHIAGNHGVSTRYVQHLFEQRGESFVNFVLEQRLLSAYRLLRDPRSRMRKISDIAAAAGFSDISYFNRAFRRRFGATPTEIRASFDCDIATSGQGNH